MKGAGKASTQSKKSRDGDPWSGRSGFTTLDKDQRVVWEPGLPAMVTSRRQHNPRKQNDRPDQQADELSCDLKAVLKLAPEPRVEWLVRVLKGIHRGLVKAQDVFDIVTHPRFTAGSGNRVGQKMLRCVTDNILAFSEKQRDAFAKSKLFQEFAVQSQLQQQADSDDEEDEAPRSRSASSSSAGADRRHRSRSRDGKERSSLPAELPGRPRSKDEDPLVQEALRELEEQREADRRHMEEERRVAMEKEQMRKAKLGSAFLVDDEEEEDAPSMPMVVKKSNRNEDRNEERPRLIDYAGGSSNSAASSDNPVEAARFVESMGGGSILQQAHKMLLQKAGGEMRSPSVVRRDRKKAEEKRRSRSREKSRSRTRRRRSPTPPRRQIMNRRSRSRSERPPAGRGGGVRSSGGRDSGSYRSPTPDGRARGQARAARKAKMIASMLGMPIPQR